MSRDFYSSRCKKKMAKYITFFISDWTWQYRQWDNLRHFGVEGSCRFTIELWNRGPKPLNRGQSARIWSIVPSWLPHRQHKLDDMGYWQCKVSEHLSHHDSTNAVSQSVSLICFFLFLLPLESISWKIWMRKNKQDRINSGNYGFLGDESLSSKSLKGREIRFCLSAIEARN